MRGGVCHGGIHVPQIRWNAFPPCFREVTFVNAISQHRGPNFGRAWVLSLGWLPRGRYMLIWALPGPNPKKCYLQMKWAPYTAIPQ